MSRHRGFGTSNENDAPAQGKKPPWWLAAQEFYNAGGDPWVMKTS